jgi:hypothetical protein
MCLDFALHVGVRTKAMRGEVSSECASISHCTLDFGQKRCGEKRQVNVSRFRVARWISDKSGAGRSVKSMCLDFASHVGFRTKAVRGEVSSECVSISRCTLDFG